MAPREPRKQKRKRMMSPGISRGVASLLVATILLFFGGTLGTEPPDDEILVQGYENVYQYRRRLGIEYNYTTQWLSEEMCRALDPEACRALDEAFGQGVLSNKKLMAEHKHRRLQGTSSSMRVLVLLVQFSNHGERSLVPPQDIETIFNAQEPNEELIPAGSVSS
jgi:hypothetical protein